MAIIAGHTFDSNDRCTGTATTVVDGVAMTHVCGRRWIDIMDCDDSCVGQNGFAHVSQLNARELKEIQDERERRLRLYEAATKGVSGGVAAGPVSEMREPTTPADREAWPETGGSLGPLPTRKFQVRQWAIAHAIEDARSTGADASFRLSPDGTYMTTAAGMFLDMFAPLYGCRRDAGESDATFRERILAAIEHEEMCDRAMRGQCRYEWIGGDAAAVRDSHR